jgi:hypothetical protein
MKSRSRTLIVPFLAAAAAVAVAPGTAAAFHTDITGVASCLASNGTYSVNWTVTVPNEAWAIGFTATLSSSVALSPGGSLGPGQTATGTGTGYTAATASISVTSVWTSGANETNTGSVARPTTPCPTPTTTTTLPAPTTIAPTTTAAPVDVCSNIDGLQTAVPVGYVANGAICTPTSATPAPATTSPVAAPADVCSNLGGVQPTVPAGYVLRNGRCISTQAAAAGVGGTSGSTGLLPETGMSAWPMLLAATFVGAGALALWLVGRPTRSSR